MTHHTQTLSGQFSKLIKICPCDVLTYIALDGRFLCQLQYKYALRGSKYRDMNAHGRLSGSKFYNVHNIYYSYIV